MRQARYGTVGEGAIGSVEVTVLSATRKGTHSTDTATHWRLAGSLTHWLTGWITGSMVTGSFTQQGRQGGREQRESNLYWKGKA